MTQSRVHWGNRLGFVLAAAGSAIGLGNLWKFPYITGENGGGWFVLIYLVAIALIGLPVMTAEIFIGRAAQSSPVGAFRALSRPGSPWIWVGGIGVFTAFVALSYYCVVSGWALHYIYLSMAGKLNGLGPLEIGAVFSDLHGNAPLNVAWLAVFLLLTLIVVLGGVRKGVERSVKILMPILIGLMVLLFARAVTSEGFTPAVDFVFGLHGDRISGAGILEAVGHAFFTLGVGAGVMITYGSYLERKGDLFRSTLAIGILDTVIALLACLIIFPILFTYGMEPAGGPGLIFQSIPIALIQMPGGSLWSATFFLLVTFAALTSTISIFEVVVSFLIDERGWSRAKSTWICGLVAFIAAVPSALSGGTGLFGARFASWNASLFHLLGRDTGMNWFDTCDYLVGNWLLPLSGLGVALFVAWRVTGEAREQGFQAESRVGRLYWGWLYLLRYVVPLGMAAVFLHAIGVL